MAYQQSGGTIPRFTGVGLEYVGLIKFKFTSGTAVSILAGNEFVNTITVTTNTNAAVATVTLNCSIPDVQDIGADFRDDGQAGFWATVGNVANEASNNLCTFKIAFFNAGGSTVTTNNLNANSAVCAAYVWFRNSNVDKGN